MLLPFLGPLKICRPLQISISLLVYSAACSQHNNSALVVDLLPSCYCIIAVQTRVAIAQQKRDKKKLDFSRKLQDMH